MTLFYIKRSIFVLCNVQNKQKMKQIIFLLSAMLLVISCGQNIENIEVHIIPKPQKIVIENGTIDIQSGINISTENIAKKTTENFTNYLKDYKLNIVKKGIPLLLILKENDTKLQNEGYSLQISKKNIRIEAGSEAGIFYGLQSLLQLAENGTKLPLLYIEDTPRFAYRGLMMDVSRHFFDVAFVKKQLDMLAYLKMNRFHWHLTDGTGWRVAIDKYPKLTEIASWRSIADWKQWWASDRKYVTEDTPNAYGGFYTKDEMKEIVAYAKERHITVIPEIEMPGHSEEVLAVYPELACTEKPYTSSEFCIGNKKTYTFLEDVLTEVIEIFPSEYIHIGGDEASREHWKKCKKCQRLMKKEGMKEEAELQSYLIKHIEKFLHTKGRKLIGWDEILEGGLAPDATVMSWRGVTGGIEALKMGHNVVMTPGQYVYLDAYQAKPDTQPEAIGGFLPLEKAYSYNPMPEGLTPEQENHLLGVQGNIWTEYVPTPEHLEYMIYPRLLAIAELGWTQEEHKNWTNFKQRVNLFIPKMQEKGYNPYTLSTEPDIHHTMSADGKSINVYFSTERFPVDVHYTLDGSLPTHTSAKYTDTIKISDSSMLTAQLYQNGKAIGSTVSQQFDYHKAIGKKIQYAHPINTQYPANGELTLIDGLTGGYTYGDGRWLGFLSEGVDVTIDLEKPTDIRTVKARFMQSTGPWVWYPTDVYISISNDGKNFEEIAHIINEVPVDAPGTIFQNFQWQGDATARYIRYKATPNDKEGWLFVDEIVIL